MRETENAFLRFAFLYIVLTESVCWLTKRSPKADTETVTKNTNNTVWSKTSGKRPVMVGGRPVWHCVVGLSKAPSGGHISCRALYSSSSVTSGTSEVITWNTTHTQNKQKTNNNNGRAQNVKNILQLTDKKSARCNGSPVKIVIVRSWLSKASYNLMLTNIM